MSRLNVSTTVLALLLAATVAYAQSKPAAAADPKAATGAAKLKCPADMAEIPGLGACIDRWEASLDGGAMGEPDGKTMTATAVSKKGVMPAVMVSQLQAIAACARAEKHLCTRAEWSTACKGAGNKRKYAYGPKFIPARCNDRAVQVKTKQQKPSPTGSLPACKTAEGVYDLSGNVWEWIAVDKPDWPTASMMGGGFGNDDNDDNLSCEPEDPLAQPLRQQIEGVGFRCCRSLSDGK